MPFQSKSFTVGKKLVRLSLYAGGCEDGLDSWKTRLYRTLETIHIHINSNRTEPQSASGFILILWSVSHVVSGVSVSRYCDTVFWHLMARFHPISKLPLFNLLNSPYLQFFFPVSHGKDWLKKRVTVYLRVFTCSTAPKNTGCILRIVVVFRHETVLKSCS